MNASPEPRVVVVGGGLAGIAAALACAEGGARVTLVEASPRLGGAASSFRRRGLWVDNGQHVFLRCCTAYRRLLERLGTDSLTVLQERLRIPVLHPDGRHGTLGRSRLPAPLHLAGALARYPFLRPRERARAALAALRLARLDRARPDLDDRTFGAWLARQRQSPDAVACLWDLICLPALNLPAARASLDLAAMVFQTGLLRSRDAADIGYALVPLDRLHGQPAARALERAGVEVRLGARVRRVTPELAVVGEGWELEARAVISAVPHEVAADLLPLPAAGRFRELGRSPIVNVHVIYDRRVTGLPFAAGVGTPVQWVFDRTQASGLGQGQYLAISLSGAEGYVDRSAPDLRREFLSALEQLFPAARQARVLDCFVTRERAATFLQAPGAGRLRPGPVTEVPGLLLAGAWTATGWPATMEGAVRSGVAAARAALLHLGRTRGLPEEVAA